MNDPYQILGVSEKATDDEVKKAYRDLITTMTILWRILRRRR